MEKKQNINDLIKNHESSINKINESIMSSEFHPINQVYFDLACLKDTRMGLMLHLSDEKMFAYIKEGLERYNRRPNRSFTFAYPEFSYSEEDLRQKYVDPELSDHIFNRSPDTDLLFTFNTILNQIKYQNGKAGHRLAVPLNINIWPLIKTPLIERFASILGSYLHPAEFSLNIFSTDPTKLSAAFWAQQDFLFVDDLQILCKEECALYNLLLIERKCLNKFIFAAPTLGDKELEIWKSEGLDFSDSVAVLERFELTALYFSTCCKFTFVPFAIPIPEKK